MRIPRALVGGLRRSRIRTLTAATVGIAAIVAAGAGAIARADNGHSNRPPSDSLRSLAAPIGLRIGTAIIPYDLDHPDYAQIAGDQFSSVTPGNEMKWQIVEPTRGTYDWSGGDRLVQLRAAARPARPRSHARVAQPAAELADRRVSPTARSATPSSASLLQKHIIDEVDALQGQDLAVGRRERVLRERVGPATRSLTASTATTSGSSTSAKASSPTRSAGRTKPIRRRCSSTTTSTSPARTATTRRRTPSTTG